MRRAFATNGAALALLVGRGCANHVAATDRDAAADGSPFDSPPDASVDVHDEPDVVATALGNGTVSGDRPTPGPVVGLGDVTLVAPWTCGLRVRGEWWCWGNDPFHDHFGIVPEHRPWMAGMVQVSAGSAHLCGRRADGAVLCWGNNGNGQIGDGTDSGGDRRDPVGVVGLTDAVDVSAGDSHSCALRAGGELVCWGANFNGELGDGTFTSRRTHTLVDWVRGTPVDVEAGHYVTCALRSAGTVACWGRHSRAQGPRRSRLRRSQGSRTWRRSPSRRTTRAPARAAARSGAGEAIASASSATGR